MLTNILLRNVSPTRQKNKQISPLGIENGKDKTHFLYRSVQLYMNFDSDVTTPQAMTNIKHMLKFTIRKENFCMNYKNLNIYNHIFINYCVNFLPTKSTM